MINIVATEKEIEIFHETFLSLYDPRIQNGDIKIHNNNKDSNISHFS